MNTPHVSDAELLLFLDGEIGSTENALVREHLNRCDTCRMRKDQLTRAAREFEMAYRGLKTPSIDAPRSFLIARLGQPKSAPGGWPRILLTAAAAVLIGIAVREAWPVRTSYADFAPVPGLTPGATRDISRDSVCADGQDRAELRRVAHDVAQQVFLRYGIQSPSPRTYEIDHLIPTDLGGSEDPRNLWPQPYARGVWNARVKDALEERLRTLVCDGRIDLATAQRELARDWIGAYKRYFQTDKPLLDHVAFYKDHPWE